MQPGSAERHAGFDHPGAELVKKFAIAGDKATAISKGEPLDPLKPGFAETTEHKIASRVDDFHPSLQTCSPCAASALMPLKW
jgi:hypothetical protein